MTASAYPLGSLSCVVDSDPRFHLEALRWFATAQKLAGIHASDLIVHVVGGRDSEVLEYLRDCGVAVRNVEPFDSRSPHCNKVSGALDLAVLGIEGPVVMTDTDVVVLKDPRKLAIPAGSVASRPVDRHIPTLPVITKVFEAADLPIPGLWPVGWEPGEQTLAGNGNGGFYLVSPDLIGAVASSWARWSSWLLDHAELLEDRRHFVDQVAMALALAAEGIPPHKLGEEWNVPTHRTEWISGSNVTPSAIHYHRRVGMTGLILETGIEPIDEQIRMANDAITQIWNEALPGRMLQEWVERSGPDPDPPRNRQALSRARRFVLLARGCTQRSKTVLKRIRSPRR